MKRTLPRMSRLPALSLLCCGLASAAPDAAAIDALAERALQAFDVPGMVVSIVVDDAAVHAAGYGIAEIGGTQAVDEHSLFRIGSVSKAFTATALALLADEGRLDWDDPVIDHLPEFRMRDPWVTREFTIRDLLTHRSGLPLGAGDLLIFPDGNATAADVVRALRYFEPASSFRSEFAYDNLLYIVAGVVVERVSGRPFADFLEQRLLAPLGMSDCVASADRAAPRAVLATPHVRIDGELETTSTRMSGVVAAAGGIACSARSMTRWMSFMLNEGRLPGGERLLSEAQFRELVRPVTLLGVPAYLAEHSGASLNAYALGWGISTFYGEPLWSHGGGVWGMTTFLAVLPEQRIAVFASGNQLSAAPRALVNAIVHEYLAAGAPDPATDWLQIIATLAGDRSDAAEAAVAADFAARNADSSPSLPLDAYVGTYRDRWYGDVSISRQDDGRLYFVSSRNPPLSGPLEHFQYDTFVARWTDRQLMADAYVNFVLAADGSVERIRMQAVSPATDFSFDFHDLDLRRVAEP